MQTPDRARAGGAPRLRKLVAASASARAASSPQCELCSEPIAREHRHLLNVPAHELLCVCRACAILFDRREAGGAHYRLVPDGCRYVDDLQLDDALWERLRIPVGMAFCFYSSLAERTVALYPGPMGAAESLLEPSTWDAVLAANPVLRSMEPDVEALLVNRARGARDHWIAPIDVCYRLVGLIRSTWKGLAGGQEVWSELERFFDDLTQCSVRIRRDGQPAARDHSRVTQS
ncbi:MAG TPA: DUF5947 family protein [Gemmatimonadaceae bacterium]|nr:DUF5947 family protein [Gemmatimonadaceae bacterium]